jgi:hypothetical protein
MGLLIILPSETALLAHRRYEDKDDSHAIMHAIDSDVFHYLCAQTDWTSGTIGKRSLLSYARIALALTEDIPRKSNRSLRKVSRNDVRNSVKRLVRVGLFSNESSQSSQFKQSMTTKKHNALMLRRPFWLALLTEQETENNIDTQQIAGFIAQCLKNKAFKSSHLQKYSPSNFPDSYTADATYNTVNITNPNSSPFCLSLTWQPEREFVDLFLKASGFSGSQIKKIWFGKYVQYWSSQTIQRTQREWSAHFANHMQGYLLRPNHFEKLNGMMDDEPTQVTAVHRATTKTKQKVTAKRLRVPTTIDANVLQQWAVDHNLPTALAGLSTEQYRQSLFHCIERMNLA